MTIKALSSLSAGVDSYQYYASRLHIPSMKIRPARTRTIFEIFNPWLSFYPDPSDELKMYPTLRPLCDL